MTLSDIFNLVALVISMIGTFMMFHFSPKVSSKLVLRMCVKMPEIEAKDRYKNKMIRRGMFLLFIGFILQAIAIFISVVDKTKMPSS